MLEGRGLHGAARKVVTKPSGSGHPANSMPGSTVNGHGEDAIMVACDMAVCLQVTLYGTASKPRSGSSRFNYCRHL